MQWGRIYRAADSGLERAPLAPAGATGERAGFAWTEYNLYYSYARHSGLWERFHAPAPFASKASVWEKEQFAAWRPCPEGRNSSGMGGGGTSGGEAAILDQGSGEAGGEGKQPAAWAVVQSRLQIPGKDIYERVRPCIEAPRTRSAEKLGGLCTTDKSDQQTYSLRAIVVSLGPRRSPSA